MDARTFTTTDYQWMMMGTSFAIIQQVKSKEMRAVGYTAGAGLVEVLGLKQDRRVYRSSLNNVFTN
eukprot:scaffold16628_cov43-Cyclotella_meneghiniana.AAC.1